MAELEPAPAPPRPELLRLLRAQLGSSHPQLRFVAEALLGVERPIDWVALESSGRCVLLLVGAEGEDLELLGRGLAQASWVEARLGDWRQLSPQLGLDPGAGVAVMLLCPSFGAETRAAAASLGPKAPELLPYRCVRVGSGVEVLLETGIGGSVLPAPTGPLPEPSPFRSGLSDAQLALTPEERAEFEAV